MPRSPKSSSPRWTMPSFFSSGFSSSSSSSRRAPTTTTPKEDSVKKENPTPTNKGEAATPAKTKEEAGPWVLLHDRDGSPFLWNKSTGQWSLDGIAVYDPPAPAIDAVGYSCYGVHEPRQQQQQQQQQQQWQQYQQHQQQQQMCSYVQPNAAYCAPGPYAVAPHYAWQQSHTKMTPSAPGAAPMFFYGY